ncbi:hypothetical protein ACFLSA_00810, partial [Bacteroidota bacterium]
KIFEDPDFRLFFKSSIGIPTSIYMPEFIFKKVPSYIQNVEVDGPGMPDTEENAFTIAVPARKGLVADTILSLNSENSNIADALNLYANRISYGLNTIFNKEGYTNTNFITDSSKFDLAIGFEMPLSARAPKISLTDTIPFDFKDLPQELDLLEEGTFYLNVTNSFPIEVDLQLYFTDENYTILDSLLFRENRSFIESAKVGTDGKVSNPSKKLNKHSISQRRLKDLQDSEYIIFTGSFSTYNEGNAWVHFYSYYYLKVKLSILADITVDF